MAASAQQSAQHVARSSELYMASSSHVGIGTIDPVTQLQVIGDVSYAIARDSFGWHSNAAYQTRTAISQTGLGSAAVAGNLNYGVTSGNNWLTFITTTYGASGFSATVFDGRYVYYIPGQDGTAVAPATVLQYDPYNPVSGNIHTGSLSFLQYTVFAGGYNGGVYDGRYVYLVPAYPNCNVFRYDTSTNRFTESSSWNVFNPCASVISGVAAVSGFAGGVFDGRYVYLIPSTTAAAAEHGVMLRFDPKTFSTASSWLGADLQTTVNAVGFSAGAFDGRYVYLVPLSTAAGTTARFVRYDTTTTMTGFATFSALDQFTFGTAAQGYYGGTFDGRYVYFVPSVHPTGPTAHSLVLRFDTAATVFSALTGWSAYAVPGGGYQGAVFDGRFVYLVGATGVAGSGIARYDTTLTFNEAASWAHQQYTAAGTNMYVGGVFDGRYVYFAPRDTTTDVCNTALILDTGAMQPQQRMAHTARSSELFVASNGKISINAVSTPIQQLGVAGDVGAVAVRDRQAWMSHLAQRALYATTSNKYASPGAPLSRTAQLASATPFSGQSYANGAFDGRFMYFAPFCNSASVCHGNLLRYDTTNINQFYQEWTSVNLEVLLSAPTVVVGFSGAVFDGRYLYLVPFKMTTLVIYDTLADFSLRGSYQTIDVAPFTTVAQSYYDAVFDGRFVYFVPFSSTSNPVQMLVHLPGSATAFTTVALGTNTFFAGGVLDGTYLYLVPYKTGALFSGTVYRYGLADGILTQFTAVTTCVGCSGYTQYKGYMGGVFDGRFVYFVPADNGGFSANLLRYDTVSPFTEYSSWSVFDIFAIGVMTGYAGAVFDGRFVYIVPMHSGPQSLVIYDTLLPFDNALSYSSINLIPAGFCGALFDGRYVYLTASVAPMLDTAAEFNDLFYRLDTGAYEPQQSAALAARSSELFVSSAGNVGLGTATPQTKLEVIGDLTFAAARDTFGWSTNSVPHSTMQAKNNAFGGSVSAGLSFTDAQNWKTFVLISKQYSGAAFDGRYVYYAPFAHTAVLRYDTTGSFDLASSFVERTVTTVCTSFINAVFDGRYVWFIPNACARVLRYDTTLLFTNLASSWLEVSLSALAPAPTGLSGAVMAGQYLYLAPEEAASVVVRFTSAGSPQSVDLHDVAVFGAVTCPEFCGYASGAFDGRYVYFAPLGTTSGPYQTHFIRHDTAAALGAGWHKLDLDTAEAFAATVFDGRFVYLVPYSGTTVIRYDTESPVAFTVTNEDQLTSADISALGPAGYCGAAFDGRYIYFAGMLSSNGHVRFDTTTTFKATNFELHSSTTDVRGAVFDGRFVYFVPNSIASAFERFDTGTPAPASDIGQTARSAELFVNNLGNVGIGNVNNYVAKLGVAGDISADRAVRDKYGWHANAADTAVLSGLEAAVPAGHQLVSDLFDKYLVGVACSGAAFDGRYVYLTCGAQFKRYDTTLPLSDSTAYLTFSLGAAVYTSAVFTGELIQFVPGTTSGTIARYDPRQRFTYTSSYANCVDSLSSNGAVAFDGAYVYVAPVDNVLLRYTTAADLVAACGTVQSVTLAAGLTGFADVLFDGRYVYYAPSASHTNAVRCETASFVAGSCTTYVVPYSSALAFDGRFVYFIPSSESGHVVMRYDSTASVFSVVTSWSSFNLFERFTADYAFSATVGVKRAAAFDQRYLYVTAGAVTPAGAVFRYDTRGAFSDVTSWTALTVLDDNSYHSTVYTGRYLYFVPNSATARLYRYDTGAMTLAQSAFSAARTAELFGDGSGRIGINTKLPLYQLDVNGDMSAQAVRDAFTWDTNSRYQSALVQSGTSDVMAGYLFTEPTAWTYQNALVLAATSPTTQFSGGVFDGRYVYMVPAASAMFVRYDTTKDLQAASSFEYFSCSACNALGYGGATFDGRFVYFAPRGHLSLVAYDTTQTFILATSWTPAVVLPAGVSFLGIATDGLNLYLSSFASDTVLTAPVTTSIATSWSDISTGTNSPAGIATGLSVAVFDGKFVWFAYRTCTVSVSCFVYSYEPLNSVVNDRWQRYDVGAGSGFETGAFDGRFVYFFQYASTSTFNVRIDTTAYRITQSIANSISTDATSGQSFSVRGPVAFDGRYLHMAAWTGNPRRYDVGHATFAIANFDFVFGVTAPAAVFSAVGGGSYYGAVFDGRYVYHLPSAVTGGGTAHTQLLRFDTGTPTLAATAVQSMRTASLYVSGTTSNVGVGTTDAPQKLTVSGDVSATMYRDFAGWHSNAAYQAALHGANGDGSNSRINVGGDPSASARVTDSSTATFDKACTSCTIGWYSGGFDGRYVYYVADAAVSGAATLMRYDTQQALAVADSWQINRKASSAQFTSVIVTEQAVYYTSTGAEILKWPLTAPFNLSSSVTVLTVTATPPFGFGGAVVDGDFIYLAASRDSSNVLHTTFYRFAVGSNTFEPASPAAGTDLPCVITGGYASGVSDGRWIYFTPNTGAMCALRYDTTVASSTFTGAMGWQSVSIATVDSITMPPFHGGVYDGRYVYFAPETATTADLIALRYDTAGGQTRSDLPHAFADLNNWQAYQLAGATGPFLTSAFDGRYVYYCSGDMWRYDTTLTFASSGSWRKITLAATAISGAVFDGRYLHLSALGNRRFIRYDTGAPQPVFSLNQVAKTSAVHVSAHGRVGINTNAALHPLDVNGAASVSIVRDSAAWHSNIAHQAHLSTGTAGTMLTNTAVSYHSLASAGFVDAVYDGRFVYYVESGAANVQRYDSSLDFDVSTSWSTLDFATVCPTGCTTWSAAVFVNQYLCMSSATLFTCYDTRLEVTPPSFRSVANTYGTFSGAVVFNNKIYFAPDLSVSTTDQIVQLDLSGPLTASAVTVGAATFCTNCRGYAGACHDGRYVYFAPFGDSTTNNGYMLRYDSKTSFAAGSFEFFDITTAFSLQIPASASVTRFYGCVTIDRYVYFMPATVSPAIDRWLVRFDTAGSFTSDASWSVLNTNTFTFTTARQFYGGISDGRYLYLLPAGPASDVVVYDTSKRFADVSSYQKISTTVAGYQNSVFDGRYVYLVPRVAATMARLDTQGPAPVQTAAATARTTDLFVASNGNVGIGTTQPTASLHVADDIKSQSYQDAFGYVSSAADIAKRSISSSTMGAGVQVAVPLDTADQALSLLQASVGYGGAVFDGRYVYASSLLQAAIHRYDTTIKMDWGTTYEAITVAEIVTAGGLSACTVGHCVSFGGAVFTGQYVVFPPTGDTTLSPVVILYDVTKTFHAASSWASVVLTSASSVSYLGGVFDGYNVYLAPSSGEHFAVLSMGATITASGGLPGVAHATGYAGAAFDGAYIYYAPYSGSLLLRRELGAAGAFVSFDISAFCASCTSFAGAVFDGRFVYYASRTTAASMLRYDTSLPFGSTDSYTIMAVAPSGASASGAAFDGRFIYTSAGGVISKYDTVFEVTTTVTVGAAATRFCGAVFDGRFLYFMPGYDTTAHIAAVILDTGSPSVQFGAKNVLRTSDVFVTPTGKVGIATTEPTRQLDVVGSIKLSEATLDEFGWSDTNIRQAERMVNAKASAGTGFSDIRHWDTLVTGSVRNPGGAAFDGRYLYVAPLDTTGVIRVMRYDTVCALWSTDCWDSYDITTVQYSFKSLLFDGRYIVFVPNVDNSAAPATDVVRYDTTLPFTVATSWPAPLPLADGGFAHAVTDGTNIYFAPYLSNQVILLPVGVAYSTGLAAVAMVSQSIIVGRHLYLIPASSGAVSRIDLASNAPGTPVVVTTVGPLLCDNCVPCTTCTSYGGVVYDGRYLYMSPSSSPTFVRYDTTADFSDWSAWQQYSPSAPVMTFRGGVFDGRYIYYASSSSMDVLRYDTTQSFSRQASYEVFAPAAVGGTVALGFYSVVFDGRYVYFMPNDFAQHHVRYDTLSVSPQQSIQQVARSAELYLSSYENNIGIGTTAPKHRLDVQGSIRSSQSRDAHGWVSGARAAAEIAIAPTSLRAGNKMLIDGFDLTPCSAGAPCGFKTAIFDGRYVYWPAAVGAFVIRYDSTTPFASAAFANFDVSAVPSASTCSAFTGGAFDGFILTLVTSTCIVRYDTSQPFLQVTSWLGVAAGGVYSNAFFDGVRVWLLPGDTFTTFARIELPQPTLTPVLDAASVVLTAAFSHAVSDGAYLYFAPLSHRNAYRYCATCIPSYDVMPNFEPFDISTVTGAVVSGSPTFAAVVFDGRYVYFVPSLDAALLRYDTASTFTAASSWQVIATGNLYSAAVFVGSTIYMWPDTGTAVTALSVASNPSVLPPTYSVASVTGSACTYSGRYIYCGPLGSVGDYLRYQEGAGVLLPGPPQVLRTSDAMLLQDGSLQLGVGLKIGMQLVTPAGVNIPGGGTASSVLSVEAVCPLGKFVISGGCSLSASINTAIVENFPFSLTRWKCTGFNGGVGACDLFAYAICAPIS
eukprot:TRINITY_DN1206_c0_g1_i5.p1 TRINITY_DN1206_c0_g1~~TRINITY_DN1206_c0_g1_i5.p1  ORF type:complete len:4563 (-),score=1064.68 TRINITY_DN1206_c0_g1_i5:1590-14723(-)